jgi:hypothetical protein
VALAHHAERIANQQNLYPASIHHGGKAGIVAGQHSDFFTLFTQGIECRDGDRFAVL